MRRQLGLLLSLVSLATGTAAASAQVTSSPASDGPRFLLATSSAMVPIDAQHAPVLGQRVSLNVVDGSIEAAFAELTRQTGVHFVYSTDVVPLDRRVRVQVRDVPMATALSVLLTGTELDVVVPETGATVIVRPREREAVERAKAAVPGIIEGFVREKDSGTPVIHAEVSVVGGGRALTNENGRYEIRDVEPGPRTVVVSSIGYVADTSVVMVPEGGRVVHNVVLEVSPTKLADLVVTATGRQRRVELGHDVTIIRVDSIMQREPVTSVTELLEGRVPGLVVQRTSGAPGDPARIRIRGASSPLLSNDPIIVVDGVRVYSGLSDDRAANLALSRLSLHSDVVRYYNAPSPLDYIDPHSIETIQVIKGPSAATMFGQDAANGVIVITTKQGRPGPARWNITAERGVTSIPGEYPELMLRLGRYYTDDRRVVCPVNGFAGGTSWYGGEACLADTLAVFQILNDPELTVLDRGEFSRVSVGVSGGTSSITYSINGSYRDERGLIKLPDYEVERYRTLHGNEPPEWMRRPQHFKQWGVTARATAQLGEHADVSVTASMSRTDQRRSSLEQQLGTLMSTYLDRSSGTYYQYQNIGGLLEETKDLLADYSERATALATQFTNGITVNWRPSSWLSLTSDLGLQVVQRDDQTFVPTGALDSAQLGRIGVGKGTSLVRTANLRAQSRVPVGRGFQIYLNTGVNYNNLLIDDLSVRATRLPEGIESVARGQVESRDARHSKRSTYGWYVEPGVTNGRLWLSSGMRLDGASSFGGRQRLPRFPKLSASYLVSEEAFFPEGLRPVVGTLRLRAAFGHAGRQPGPTDRLRLYGSRDRYWIEDGYAEAVFLHSLGNTRLKPERSKELEAGFDADLLDDRLTLSVTAYRKTTEDALLRVPVAPSVYGTGVTRMMNIGVVRNSGIEITAGLEPIRSDAVTWRTQVHFSRNRNLVVELGPGVEPFYTQVRSYMGDQMSGIRVAPGYPLFGRWARPVLGYADANGDGVLDRSEIVYGDTMVYVGGTLPDYSASLHSTFVFFRGALSVTTGWLYESGSTQINEVTRRLAPFSRGWNDPSAPLADQLPVFDVSEFSWIQTTNSLRLNTLSVTYQLPTGLASRLGARAMSLSVQGTNLALWTNYTGMDPNVNVRVVGTNVADTGILPTPRSWQIKLNASY